MWVTVKAQGAAISINLDKVRTMERCGDSTRICFGQRCYPDAYADETPEEILEMARRGYR